jgi:hypothetical protein
MHCAFEIPGNIQRASALMPRSSSGTHEAPARKTIIIMFLTIAAVVACISVVVLPAAAELRRVIDDRENPTRLLKIPTRRSQVEGAKGK